MDDTSRRLIALLPELRGDARFLARHPAEADGLVQEAVVRALPALPGLAADRALRPWLFTILRNALFEPARFEPARRRGRGRRVLSQQESGAVARSGQHGGAELAELERQPFALPPLQREAPVLVGARGLSCDQAAIICGIPVGTMKARVSRARRRVAGPLMAHPAVAADA